MKRLQKVVAMVLAGALCMGLVSYGTKAAAARGCGSHSEQAEEKSSEAASEEQDKGTGAATAKFQRDIGQPG